jgi:uncharacterized protein (DUF1330 family)
VSGLDITPDALERFLATDDGLPVVLVNLVRLRAGGQDAYRRYAAVVGPLLGRVGAEVLYAGEARGVLIGDEDWDYAAVTRYPRRAALAELVRDPEFEAAAPLRHEALEAGILYAFA